MSVESLLERLAAVERRLAKHAGGPTPAGHTEPDPGGDERWEAGQVWAHLAEFPRYWLDQVVHVTEAAAHGEPEPIGFGRTKTDAGRLAAIERDRHERPTNLLARVRTGIVQARRTLATLPADSLGVVGRHPTLGEMSVERIVEHFLVEHLEEHAAQLDGLVGPRTDSQDDRP